MASDESCGNCRFWFDTEEGDGYGECRRRAPQPMAGEGTDWSWPAVWRKGWCGEWQWRSAWADAVQAAQLAERARVEAEWLTTRDPLTGQLIDKKQSGES